MDVEKIIEEEVLGMLCESGERFKALAKKLGAEGAENPAALAAHIGRKKYGKEGFAELSKSGKKKSKKRG